MTPEEFLNKQRERLRSLNIEQIVYEIATKVHDDMSVRLFDSGIMGNGQKIGVYSQKAMYASRNAFKNKAAFKAQGKKEYIKGSPKDKLKTAKGKLDRIRKSMYLPNGYRELKAIQGYESGFVNLTYTTDLRKDFDSVLQVDGERVVLRLKRQMNALKAEGLTKKYGPTLFKHDKEEREFFEKEVTKRIIQGLQ